MTEKRAAGCGHGALHEACARRAAPRDVMEVDWDAAGHCSPRRQHRGRNINGRRSASPSDNGIVGHATPRSASCSYPLSPAGAIVLHSDGLTAGWQPERYPA